MKINENLDISFKDKLINRLSVKNISLNEQSINRLVEYKEMLIECNKTMNLTAITKDDEVIEKHFIDSLECSKYIKESDKILDVGTGAGFPGMVLSIALNGKPNITLLDSLNKRLIFLDDVIKKLDLKNIKTAHLRAEEGANLQQYREKYDIVTSRAVASLNILLEYNIPYLKVGGKAIIMKGDNVSEEIELSKNALKELNCKIISVNEYKLEVGDEIFTRNIIVVEKQAKTNTKYPRIFGKIKKSPL